ncbi:hypothetical protein Aperf_G00000101892 [Anoplocephala perfoliata]
MRFFVLSAHFVYCLCRLFIPEMDILFVLIALSLVVSAIGSNYDAYLADMNLRNRELHNAFRQNHPNGDYVLDFVMSSPEFRQAHPILREYDDQLDYDERGTDDAWDRLLASLAFAEETARYSDPEAAAKRVQTWLSEQAMNNTPARARVYPAYPGSEFAPQDNIWGTHSVSGGSSEVGSWMDYAVYGAQAQEDEDDEEDDREIVGKPIIQHSSKSDVKLDKLPAYCDPPNPCPVGYDPDTLATPCDKGVENTVDFNRNWILQKMQNGECSCDQEHMLSCSRSSLGEREHEVLNKRRFEEFSFNSNPYLLGEKRSSMVAKKNYHKRIFKSRSNPFSEGERLESIVKKSGPFFPPP